MFGGAGLEHMKRYGTTLESFAKVRAQASRHAAKNPLAIFRKVLTTEAVMADQVMWPGVMTRLDGRVPRLAVLPLQCSAATRRLDRAGQIGACGLPRRPCRPIGPMRLKGDDMRNVVGYSMAQKAAQQVYEASGIGPYDVDVVELHDCFAHNELITYEALGLCPEGGAQKFIDDGDNTYGGRYITNPSGGTALERPSARRHGVLPSASNWTQQLRGRAEARQVDGARVRVAAQPGIGGACVVTMYCNQG
jgi:acetyl-CoA acetyltransferase